MKNREESGRKRPRSNVSTNPGIFLAGLRKTTTTTTIRYTTRNHNDRGSTYLGTASESLWRTGATKFVRPNLVNKANCCTIIFGMFISFSTCFGWLCAHHQEKKLYLCDSWYLLFCMDDWYAEAYAPPYQSFISFRYIFRATMCPSSGEITVYATLGTCYSVWSICSCIPDSHPYRITSNKCRINTVVSPHDGHIVARNMYRKEINTIGKAVHQVGFIYKIVQGCTVNKT